MALSAGDRLGPYEILEPLGAGGMGEVYRAKDVRLDRVVAVKILPSDLSDNPKLRQRLEREARAISQLSHPNICALYDVGREGKTDFLVMEHLEGQTLADRLHRGRLSVAMALRYASEIAEALHHAHHHGVIHRDLKPGNIMLTRSGPKLLDFGLAKLHEPERAIGGGADSSLPTLGEPLTEEGMILGSYPYMAPEQLEGRPADSRTDLFALGVILYEMLTGQRPFKGKSRANLIAAIMTSQHSPVASLQPLVPGLVERLVTRCLEKNPDDRWESAGDLAAGLKWLMFREGEHRPESGVSPRRTTRRTAAVALGALGLLAAVGLVGHSIGRRSGATQSHGSSSVRQLTFQNGWERQAAVSPEGRLILYVSEVSGNADIYLQRVGGQAAINLTADCLAADYSPSFAPDGNQIAFRSEREGGGVFVMGATGESVRRVSDLGHDPSWSPDGHRLVVATEGVERPFSRQAESELWIVDVGTGESRTLYAGDAVQPAWSPDGQHVAFWRVDGNSGRRDLATIRADEGSAPVTVTAGVSTDWRPVWSPNGQSLLFLSDRLGTMNLWSVVVDPQTGGAADEPSLIGAPSEDVSWLSVARTDGSIVYSSYSATHFLYSLAIDPSAVRIGSEARLLYSGALPVSDAAPSKDGSSIALVTRGRREDLYVLENEGGELRQLTDDPFRDRGPAWSPDGSQIAFYSNRSGTYQVWSIRPDGSRLTQLTDIPEGAWYPYWSPDGTRIAFPTGTKSCIVTLEDPPAKDAECVPNLSDQEWFQVRDWSPDGRWLSGNRALLYGDLLPEVMVWSLETKAYERFETPSLISRWMPDSRHLVLLGEHGQLSYVDHTSGAVMDLGTPDIHGKIDPSKFGLSRDGRMILLPSKSVEGDVWMLSPLSD